MRNSEKAHYRSLGYSMTDTNRGLAIADSTKLRTGRGIHRWKTLTSKERLVLPHFKISQRENSTNCSMHSRPK